MLKSKKLFLFLFISEARFFKHGSYEKEEFQLDYRYDYLDLLNIMEKFSIISAIIFRLFGYNRIYANAYILIENRKICERELTY